MTGAQFARILKAKGWSQRQAAEILGVTEAAVSLWINGKRPIAGPAERLIRVLGASK